jgi:RNA polymerase-binding transcription factor DksA
MAQNIDPKTLDTLRVKLEAQKTEISQHIHELGQDDPFQDPDHSIDNAAIDTDVREQIGHDTVEAEVKELKERLEDIVHALQKMNKGTYGVCEKCAGDINPARLALVPEARKCMDCAK